MTDGTIAATFAEPLATIGDRCQCYGMAKKGADKPKDDGPAPTPAPELPPTDDTGPVLVPPRFLAAKLKALVADVPESGNEIGRRLGIGGTHVSRLTLGKSDPTIEQFVALARYFRVSLEWLVDDDQPIDLELARRKPSTPKRLPQDEEVVLEVYRALRDAADHPIDHKEAVRRLSRLGPLEIRPADPNPTSGPVWVAREERAGKP
jgi:transcriptional regulator with XRE-family HTH domain